MGKTVQHPGQNAPSFGTKSSNYTGIKTAAPIHIGAAFCRSHPATDNQFKMKIMRKLFHRVQNLQSTQITGSPATPVFTGKPCAARSSR